MSRFIRWRVALVLVCAAPSLFAQQPDPFRWMDFHSPKDQSIVTWVTRSLDPEKWTSIREIGVQYDSALVVTTLRATPQSPPSADAFTVWSVSLTSHSVAPLLNGVNLRWLDWIHLVGTAWAEPAILYDNCGECGADTYLSAFHYDFSRHAWAARWMRGGQAAPVWSGNAPAGVDWTQVYALMTQPDGRAFLATWSHFDYGKQKPPEDFLYQYDLDSVSGLERTQSLSGKPADAMQQRLCRAQDVVAGLARGQDSALCRQILKPLVERRPTTTPPANNQGESRPGGHR